MVNGPHVARWAVFWNEQGTEEAAFVLERDIRMIGCFRLVRRFLYDNLDGTGYVVPADPVWVTDLASVPAPFTWLVPKDGSHTPAALLHDALISPPGKPAEYRDAAWDPVQGRWRTREAEPVEPVTAEKGDRIFREAMRQLGVSVLRRWMMWAAVRTRSLATPERGVRRAVWWWVVLFVVIVVLGLGGVVQFLDLLDVVTWPFPWMGDDPWWSEILSAIAATAVGVVAFLPLWCRQWRVGLVLAAGLAVFAVPLFVSAIAWALYQVAESVVYAFSDDAPENAPSLAKRLTR